MPAILEARDLTKSYRLGKTTVDALRGVSLTVEAGEFVALMGPSGSGKSTLLQLLGGLDRPSTGEVVLDGEPVSALSDDAGDPPAPAQDRLRLPVLQPHPACSTSPRTWACRSPSPATIRARGPQPSGSATSIELVDLSGKERHRPDQLSAGEQQRVAIARALVTRPALLLADEPTGNLDFTTGIDILEALFRSCVERGQTIVLVTHDAKAAAYADRVFFVQDGRLRDEILLGRRADHSATPLIARLAQLGL